MEHSCPSTSLQHLQHFINDYLLADVALPHLLLYGSGGTGKRRATSYLIQQMTLNSSVKKQSGGDLPPWVLMIDCRTLVRVTSIVDPWSSTMPESSEMDVIAHIVLFMKQQVSAATYKQLKMVVMLNAEYMSFSLQSTLRRYVEIHSDTTRFVFVARNKSPIIKPLLSRVCQIFFKPTNYTTQKKPV